MDQKAEETTLLIRIKSSAPTDVTLPISSTASVVQLKESIRSALGESTQGRYIRLIYSGRLLAPDNAPLTNFKLKDGCVVHAVVAAAGVRGGQQAALSRPSRRRLRGAGVGADGLIVQRTDQESDDEEDVEAGGERLGFDRLRSEGLRRSEIGALRTYFARQVDRFIEERVEIEGAQAENDADDDDPDATARLRRFRREDEWMETQGPHSEFRLNLNVSNPLITRRGMHLNSRVTGMDPMYTGPLGTDKDFMWGFVLGYFVGFMMMFWVSCCIMMICHKCVLVE